MASFLEVVVVGDGVSAVSVKTGRPSVPYGVRRQATGESVVDSGSLLVDQGDDVWRLEDWSPEDGITYNYAYTVVWSDDTETSYSGVLTGGATVPSCDFFTYQDFITRWGEKNISGAANLDNVKSGAISTARIQMSMDYAVDEINEVLRGGVYSVPLNFALNGDVVPNSIKEAALVLAYEHLYRAKGYDDKNKVGNKLRSDVNSTYVVLAYIRAGHRQILAEKSSGVNLAMSAVSRQDILQNRIDNPVVLRRSAAVISYVPGVDVVSDYSLL